MAEIDGMSAYEFRQWQQYNRLFPFGDEREDWRMGMLAAVTVNLNSKGPRASASDFMLKPPQTQAQKDAELRRTLKRAGKPKAAPTS